MPTSDGGPRGGGMTARERGGRLGADERRVLALMATGLVTYEVADRLGMCADEVRLRLRGAMYVLGARSKLEAVMIALGQGLIDLPA